MSLARDSEGNDELEETSINARYTYANQAAAAMAEEEFWPMELFDGYHAQQIADKAARAILTGNVSDPKVSQLLCEIVKMCDGEDLYFSVS